MEKKLWFKAKRYGYGWYPSSWQGWAVLAMYVFVLIANSVYINNHEFSDSDFLMQFFPQTFIMTVFLIIICEKTGEPARWRWGKKSDDAAHSQSEKVDGTSKN